MNSVILFYLLLLFPQNGLLVSDIDSNEGGRENKADVQNQIIPKEVDSDWILFEKIKSFKTNQHLFNGFLPTGLSKSDYLEVISGQVLAMRNYQDNEGRIIDPVEKVEMYYSTPCYAHSVSVLAFSNYTKNEGLIESGMKALDISLEDMLKAEMPGGHGDFYTYPVMFAYHLFKGFAEPERILRWDFILKNLDPKKVYKQYRSDHNNWNIVNFTGEYLRYKEGFTSINYVQDCMELQLHHFTENGMYNENGNPMAYDLFARHYLSGILEAGYNGKLFSTYRELLYKGAWMSLFMQSPFGELPTGYRSSQHSWNEAGQCVVFELYANALEKAGRNKEAAAFKRGAMLSLNSVKHWIRPDGSGNIVKNKFPIEAKHGYESYSVHTCYNMLACSMLAQAWQFANNKIEEMPAPADVGGFVIPLTETFHKIIANNNGTYIEYDTKGDQKYNPTGIIRIQLKEGHPQLGPSDGCASLFSGKGKSIATGPAWLDKNGKWKSLAEMQPEKPIVEILQEDQTLIKFKVKYELDNGMELSETITVNQGEIQIEDEIVGAIAKMRITWPMLVSDGKDETKVDFSKRSVQLELDSKKMRFLVKSSELLKLYKSDKKLNHRNGIIQVAYAEFEGNKATYSLAVPKN